MMKLSALPLFLLFLTILVNNGAQGAGTVEFECEEIGEESYMKYTYESSEEDGLLTLTVSWGDGSSTTSDDLGGNPTIPITAGQSLNITHTYTAAGSIFVSAEFEVVAVGSESDTGSAPSITTFQENYVVSAETCEEDTTSGGSTSYLSLALAAVPLVLVAGLWFH